MTTKEEQTKILEDVKYLVKELMSNRYRKIAHITFTYDVEFTKKLLKTLFVMRPDIKNIFDTFKQAHVFDKFYHNFLMMNEKVDGVKEFLEDDYFKQRHWFNKFEKPIISYYNREILFCFDKYSEIGLKLEKIKLNGILNPNKIIIEYEPDYIPGNYIIVTDQSYLVRFNAIVTGYTGNTGNTGTISFDNITSVSGNTANFTGNIKTLNDFDKV